MKIKVEYDLESDGVIYTVEELGLNEIIDVPNNIDEDNISDWISDQTGWCVLKWERLSERD